ncbi:uncharacterized protein N7459_004059 [Penicillium hispanicum]|uniref:uncharacterized protein n=1 Tax=Penicillium hispanicum TaxID=1080232 RepID=UPI00254162D4|nr:uncharacterized protein N7459_004059 [Penicillium hispanicum]KAJ5584259.1 hypothetical protein N7459_004059 [Penicillium hispanicum]
MRLHASHGMANESLLPGCRGRGQVFLPVGVFSGGLGATTRGVSGLLDLDRETGPATIASCRWSILETLELGVSVPGGLLLVYRDADTADFHHLSRIVDSSSESPSSPSRNRWCSVLDTQPPHLLPVCSPRACRASPSRNRMYYRILTRVDQSLRLPTLHLQPFLLPISDAEVHGSVSSISASPFRAHASYYYLRHAWAGDIDTTRNNPVDRGSRFDVESGVGCQRVYDGPTGTLHIVQRHRKGVGSRRRIDAYPENSRRQVPACVIVGLILVRSLALPRPVGCEDLIAP